MNFPRIVVVGPGLLGGSLLKALARDVPAAVLHVWARRAESAEEAGRLDGVALSTTDLRDAVRDATLVVLCTPVETMPSLAGEMADALQDGCVVTDVGSVKGTVVEAMRRIIPGRAEFLGSHPMAGSEQSGFSASTPDLFRGSCCIVTPTESTNEHTVCALAGFWEQVGCRVRRMPPADHDAAMARISHLPHVVASALVAHAAGDTDALELAGNGFRDTTRIASGSPGLWRHILEQNAGAVDQSLAGLVDSLNSLRIRMRENRWKEVEDFLGKAKSTRDNIVPKE